MKALSSKTRRVSAAFCPARDVVAAFGMKKNDKLLNQLRQLIPDVIAVGDCNEVKNIKNANQIAFNMALEI